MEVVGQFPVLRKSVGVLHRELGTKNFFEVPASVLA
jgi:hypothetical protein